MKREELSQKILELQALYRRRGWPETWFFDALKEIHIWSLNSLRHGGAYEVPESVLTGWFDSVFSGSVVRIGRLEFEWTSRFYAHLRVFRRGKEVVLLADEGGEEDAESWTGCPIQEGIVSAMPVRLLKKEWQLVAADGAPVTAIHVPEDGPLDRAGCIASLRRAAAWLQKSVPGWLGFSCQSWFLDPYFQKLLPENSNVVRFQRLGRLYPVAHPSDYAKRLYPGKLLDAVRRAEEKGHVFMTGGMLLFREELDDLT